MISDRTLKFALLLWLYLESGQFFQKVLPWGENALFWPLWLAMCVITTLGAYLMDFLLLTSNRSNEQDGSRYESEDG